MFRPAYDVARGARVFPAGARKDELEDAGVAELRCIECGTRRGARDVVCGCGGLVEVSLDLSNLDVSRKLFDHRLGLGFPYSSGVWRFSELVHPLARRVISRNEGNTHLYQHDRLDKFAGVRGLAAKHDGENPTGSFKDRGMTVAVSEALRLGVEEVCCASTGNTSSSLSSYAALAGLGCKIFVPKGKVSPAKLSQTLAYGAEVVEVAGSFDDALLAVKEYASSSSSYLVNSLNPWRIEGQKSVVFELFQQLKWGDLDWLALPAGNLGNASAVGKALVESKSLGLIDSLPKLLLVQAAGAAPFHRMWKSGAESLEPVAAPETAASAIRIGNPASWPKALRALRACGGDVEAVQDEDIAEAKLVIDRAGIGCEPASAAALAGVKKAVADGRIAPGDRVALILTGHLLKDASWGTPHPAAREPQRAPERAVPTRSLGPALGCS
ncbi:MAG TPA: threonine synthase [Thermoplasmata archaeon]|nr:threonine synthase [Thermoplasmata archaeon]